MEIKRFFIDRPVSLGEQVVITGEEYRHAIKVSRYKVGYRLILSCGDGNDYYCTVLAIARDSFTCRVDLIVKNENELPKPLALYLCAIEKIDLAVQKATEIGATEIHLLISRFTNSKNHNLDRLRKIAYESAKQCGRAIVPSIYAPVSFDDGLKDVTERFGEVILCFEGAKETRVRDIFDNRAESYALIVGSEGGFAEEEVEQSVRMGVKVVTLGRRILRAETACIAGLVLLADQME